MKFSSFLKEIHEKAAMTGDGFEQITQVLCAEGPEAGFDVLARRFRVEKNYTNLMEVRLMQKRYQLGLPLIADDPLAGLSGDARRSYEKALTEAACEVGNLFLADGDIEHAWPYFRAIGDVAPVAKAIEQVTPKEGIERIIEIAFYERANPRKGFELILAQLGSCRAVTVFSQYPGAEGREDSLHLLVRTLHDELVRNLKRAITQREGVEPEGRNIPALIKGRDWLFAGNNYYIDTSHLVSVLKYAIESSNRETLAMALEFTDYGPRLSSIFQYEGAPPFENIYNDYAFYLRALLSEDKVMESDPAKDGTATAQTLVKLLVRLGRYPEAIEASRQYLRGVDPAHLACPTVLQICQLSGDYKQLMEWAREKGDLLTYTAASLEVSRKTKSDEHLP